MKGATMKTTMEKLGITASYSRPRVSNDNPFSETLFRTCKYRPDWPTKGFATRADAQVWVKSFARWYNGEHPLPGRPMQSIDREGAQRHPLRHAERTPRWP